MCLPRKQVKNGNKEEGMGNDCRLLTSEIKTENEFQ